MDRTAFEAGLRADGFTETLIRRLEVGEALDRHTHPFDARLLILEGEYRLTCRGETRSYGPGESFELAAGIPHEEAAGPQGATYLVGRRSKP